MEKYLWEVKHDYYCNLGNYYSNGCGHTYESFDDFIAEWGDADFDMNLLFRWDWKVADPEDENNENQSDKLEIFWMLQRKGAYRFCEIDIVKEDEDKVKKFLKPRWEHLKGLWQPLE